MNALRPGQGLPSRLGLLTLLLIPAVTAAREFNAEFAVVMVDDATEKKLGAFPYDRAEYAKAVDACARLHAKAVVLKFFLDRPRSAAGDAALAAAMKNIPVLLQARLEATEGTPQELPARFRYAGGGQPAAAVGGQLGWIPLPLLLDSAAGVGFVDFDRAEIPLIEEYRHAPFKSLVLGCLELATGEPAHATGNGRIELGAQFMAVDGQNVHHAVLEPMEDLKIISFASLLEDRVAPDAIAGRVVIIGWDSAQTPALAAPRGPMKLHRFFVECLAATWRALAPTSPPIPPGRP